MACTPAPSCLAVRKQATKLWPNRSQASDGICASATHTSQNPGSDHEPHVVIDGKAYATAVDLTDDKAHGCDADAWAEYLRRARDWRVKYVICNRRMFSSYPVRGIPAWTWRTYTGANPHDKHSHLSVVREAVFDVAPWFPQLVSIDPAAPSEDDVTPTIIEVVCKAQDGKGYAGTGVRWDSILSVTALSGADGVFPKVAKRDKPQADGTGVVYADFGTPLLVDVPAKLLVLHR